MLPSIETRIIRRLIVTICRDYAINKQVLSPAFPITYRSCTIADPKLKLLYIIILGEGRSLAKAPFAAKSRHIDSRSPRDLCKTANINGQDWQWDGSAFPPINSPRKTNFYNSPSKLTNNSSRDIARAITHSSN